MDDEQKKVWDSLIYWIVSIMNQSSDWVYMSKIKRSAILAADAELTRLRAECSDLSHLAANYLGKLNALSARAEDVEGMANAIDAHPDTRILDIEDLRDIARAVSKWIRGEK